MKRSLLFFVLFTPSLGIAEEFNISDLSAGMFSFQDANRIPDNGAAFLQNVYTDINPMPVERNGYVKRDSTILGDTKAVTGLWSFTDTSGSEWIISFSSRSFYRNTVGGTPTKFGPTMTIETIPDAAVNLGKIWFTNGTSDVWWFDGTSTGAVSSAPKGRLIEPWRTRIVISRVTNTQSTVYFSEEGDGTNWTLGGLAVDPFTREIGGANDGQYVRCLANYYDSLIVGRKPDLYAIDGFDQSDITTRQISDQIGCIEPATMKVNDNELIWLSNRGVEEMSYRTIKNISEPVRNLSDVLIKNSSNQRSLTVTSQSDFGQFTFPGNASIYLDTVTVPGNLQLIFPDAFDSFRDGNNSTKEVWDNYCFDPLFTCSTTTTISDGKLKMTGLGEAVVFANASVRGMNGTTYYIVLSSLTTDVVSGNDLFSLVLSNTKTTTANPIQSTYIYFNFKSSETGKFFLNEINTSAGATSPGCSAGACSGSAPRDFDTPIFVFVSSSNFSVTIGTNTYISGTHPAGSINAFVYMDIVNGGSAFVDTFGYAPISASLTTQLNPSATSHLLTIGSDITSWSNVVISDVQNSGTITYTFGSTSTASLSSIVNYASIVNNGVPSVSTNPYAAFTSSFSLTSASGTLALQEFQINWNEGGDAPAPVSTVYDRRYWISYTTNTGSSPFLDRVLIYQRSKAWTLFEGINAASFSIWRDNLYFGNSDSTGYVYKFDIGENDDGSNISSLIKTKSYDFGQFFRPKEFRRLYFGYLGGGGGSFSVSYDIDRYGTIYSLGSVSLTGTQSQQATKFPFPLSQLVRGNEIQFTISKSDTSNRLKLYNLAGQYELKEEE